MEISLKGSGPAGFETPLLILVVADGTAPEDLPTDGLHESVAAFAHAAMASGDLKGSAKDEALFYPPEGPAARVAFLGAGSEEDLDAEALRWLGGRAVRMAEAAKEPRLSVVLPQIEGMDAESVARAIVEGAVLAAWTFRELKEPDEDDPPTVAHLDLIAPAEPDAYRTGVQTGAAAARGENLARTLQSRPGNVATPTHLAEQARALAERVGLDVTVLGPEEMREAGMEALLAVSQGSAEEPRLIVLRHDGAGGKDKPLVLVGKGLTFDAGGISLKPAAGMEDMKFDMSGGAAVLGAMSAIAEAELPVDVVGVVPSSENLPSGTAVKPGDVIGSLAGKTIEVINTDAEGRLILADALAYAARLEPAAMVDCATLTGACVVALGHHASAVMGTDDDLVEELTRAGRASGERCWPLPLWKEYRKQLDSPVADLKNIGGRPGGSITAGCFLREFVGDVPWAHLDIAGTAYGEGKLPYQRKGALGVPTRLLFEWVRSRGS